MGLDGVELILAIEEYFGISITDPEAEQIRTPRDLIAVVARKVQISNEKTCATQKAFHDLRRVLRSDFKVPRRLITPDLPLEKVFPESRERASNWARLQEGTSVGSWRWPRLRSPGWKIAAEIALSGILAFFVYWPFRSYDSTLGPGLLSLVVFTVCWFLIGRFTLRFDSVLPLATVGELAMKIAPYGGYKPMRGEIAPMVREIIRDQLGLGEFSDDDEFVKDLGID